MNRKYFALFVLAFSARIGATALAIAPKYSSAYRFTATDVWNVDLQFSGSKPLNIYMEATITGAGAGVIAKLTSSPFLLNPGIQSFSSVTLNTAVLLYQNRSIADIEATTGTFPAGNYKVCYRTYCQSPDCDGNGANALDNETPECFELVVEPPTPLLLAMPEDKSEIEQKRPTFNWIPPMPISGVNGFNYMFILVEKRKGQSCTDAIQNNRPLYKESDIEQPVRPFPGEINDLDTGKSYCWKVDGLVGQIPVAQSEVWEFKIKQDTFPFKLINIDQSYINIIDQNGQALYYALGKIKLKYVTRFGTGQITYKTTDAKNAELKEAGGSLTIQPGDNRYTLDFEKTEKLKNQQTYLLTLILPDKSQYHLKFMYIDPTWYNAKINHK